MVHSCQVGLLVGLAGVSAFQLDPGSSTPVVSKGVSKIVGPRPLPYQLKRGRLLPDTLAARGGCGVVSEVAGNAPCCCQSLLSARYYGISVTSRSTPEHPRPRWSSNETVVSVLALVLLAAGVLAIVLSLSAAPKHVPSGTTPTPAPTPTVIPTSGAHALPTPIQVILPSSIAITVNGGSGGLPAWASWLGPIGGFLTGIGALGGLVAFRRRKEQREEEQAASGPSSR